MATSSIAHAAVIRAVSYRRVSSFDQLGGTSPETQLARAEALIRQHGWEHVGDFFDGGVSGPRSHAPTSTGCSRCAAPVWSTWWW